jgi:hypothetical protein
MNSSFNLTKIDLAAFILCLRKTNIIRATDSDDLLEIKRLVPGVISILLEYCFGKYNSNLIWEYAMKTDNNKFTTLDELYDYLSDPNSNLVSDNAASLEELLKDYPGSKMLLDLKKFIDEIPS